MLSRISLFLGLALVLVAPGAQAGEPLVVKTAEGKYIPALASEWVKAGDSYRFMLKTGSSAKAVASELKAKIAPIKVKATDDVTLVFSGDKLSENTLLEKLAGIEIGQGKDKSKKDALAALASLGSEGGPALSDLSSAGSIRASRKIELPKVDERRKDPANLVGKVLKVCKCEPLPTIDILVTAVPSQGKYKDAFKPKKKISVRGFYKVTPDTKQIDPTDARTKINLTTKKLRRGDVIFGKPFLKEDKVWILETIEKK